ncbi:MAG: DEAD/DEAH box helicase [Acidobacteriota bacterium]
MTLTRFHPVVLGWFERTFSAPTEPQRLAWPAIQSGKHTLIAAPTGSGKTLAAFLSAIDQLVRQAAEGVLSDETQILYVSPLKALSNDIQRNLQAPLEAIQLELCRQGLREVPIRSWVRTGDTPASERTAMGKKPPHIVVTTPESFYILLSSDSGRRMLRTVRTVIVDEIHAVVGNKRGAHLALSLERLQALVQQPLVRIGLSATQKPIEEVARFLVGSAGCQPNGAPQCTIVDTDHLRLLDLDIELPDSPLEAVMSNEVWKEVYRRLADLIGEHRSTLVFVNTRRLSERVARHLADLLGEDQVAAHHGSLARDQRFRAEQRLKAGELRVLVATASLELGIDVGLVDLVCQLGTTRSITMFLQRVGRSGHFFGGVPKGRIFPLTRDELVEATALLCAVKNHELEALEIPRNALDILAQQIVAEVACEEWSEDALFEMVRKAYPYRDLRREDFLAVVEILSNGYATKMGRRGAYLHRDGIHHRLRGRRGARLAALTSGGAIPENTNYEVILEPAGTLLGSVEEDFAIESMSGDIFQLGNASWRILRVEPGRLRVEDAKGQPPSLPFWFGEAPARSRVLSAAVSRLRQEADRQLNHRDVARGSSQALATWLQDRYAVSQAAAAQLAEYLSAIRGALGMVPSQECLVLERFFDESGGMQLVIHSPFGSRINRAWGLALRKRFCRKFNFELQAAATEDALILSLSHAHSFVLDEVFRYLHSHTVREVLLQALLAAPMFGVRWRWNVNRSLAVLRWRNGRKVPPQIQRMNAEDLLAAVFPDQVACAENLEGEREIPDHPLVHETIRDCLEEAMDVAGLEALLADVEQGRKRLVARDLNEPSPLAAEILTARPYAFLDDAPLEERRTQAVYSRRWLAPETAADLGKLDPGAIAQVREEAWPRVENAEELHDAMLQSGFLVEGESLARDRGDDPSCGVWFETLKGEGRCSAVRVSPDGPVLWVAAERVAELRQVLSPNGAEALVEILRNRLEIAGPVTSHQLSCSMGVPASAIDAALVRLEAEGFVLRGRFTAGAAETEWCSRRLLARIHRYTLNRLRREIEPVTAADFMGFLFHWQRVSVEQRGDGVHSLKSIVELLEGFEAPAAAWEGELLPSRMANYDPAWMDQLTLSGEVLWIRLSTRAALENSPARVPIRTTPVVLIRRQNLALWQTLAGRPEAPRLQLSVPARSVMESMQERGASFFSDLLTATGLLRSQVEDGLGELAACGLIHSDSFAGLRALLTPSSRRPGATGRRRATAAPYSLESAGRWSAFMWGQASGPTSKELARSGLSQESIEVLARVYVRRYGVVFRKLLERESIVLPWRDLLRCYRRLEDRGDLRGGRFVAGFSGEQFAAPEAVGLLRSLRRERSDSASVSISAADPLNLVGIVVPGERVAQLTGNRVLFREGIPVAVREAGVVRFLTELDSAGEWEARNSLVRRKVHPQVRAYLGQPA